MTLLDTSNKATFLGVRRGPSFLPCGKARGCAGLTFGPIDYAYGSVSEKMNIYGTFYTKMGLVDFIL